MTVTCSNIASLQWRPQERRECSGFTLIEVLVVLGLIAVLMGILLPSLAGARRRGRLVTCAANLRQWGIATRMYADSFDGFLPRRGQGKQPTQKIDRPSDWFNALPVIMGQKPYSELAASGQVPRARDRSYFSCPDAEDNGKPNFWSYGMNMWLSIWDNPNPDRITAVGEPSTMVLLADGPADHCSVSPSSLPYSPVARHGGKVNIVFLDAHVVALDAAYVGCGVGVVEQPDVRWKVPGSTWSPDKSN